jgi:hypothetical protein
VYADGDERASTGAGGRGWLARGWQALWSKWKARGDQKEVTEEEEEEEQEKEEEEEEEDKEKEDSDASYDGSYRWQHNIGPWPSARVNSPLHAE